MNETKSSPPPLNQRLLYGLTSWGFFFIGFANLAIGTWAAVGGQVALAATSLAAGLVLLFAATIDRFESLKGLGVEAKTRQLDQKIEKADDALRRLNEMVEIVGPRLVDLDSKMGRWDSTPSVRESYALAQRVKGIMAKLGSEPSTISRALQPWVKTSCMDLARVLTAPLAGILNQTVQELERQRGALPQPMSANDPELRRITVAGQEINDYLQRLRMIHELNVTDYPDRFLQLFDVVPSIDQRKLEPIRTSAERFAPLMLELRNELQLANPEPWFAAVEEKRR
jgi:hypothetical protein